MSQKDIDLEIFLSKGKYRQIVLEKLSELNLFKNGLKYMAPKQKIKFFLTSLAENNECKETPIIIEVRYRDLYGKKKKYKNFYT
jgi:hypothetical protein